MKKQDYIDVLLQGYLNRKNYYRNYLLFEIQKANEQYGVAGDEFIESSINIINELINKAVSEFENLKIELKNSLKNSKVEKSIKYYTERIKEKDISFPIYAYNLRASATGFNSDNFNINELNTIKAELIKLKNILKVEEGVDVSCDEENKEFNNKLFSCSNSEALFNSYIKDFKNAENRRAEYSFLYYAMKNFNLLFCSGSTFMTELAKHDIDIDKIDSRNAFSYYDSKFNLFDKAYQLIFKKESLTPRKSANMG